MGANDEDIRAAIETGHMVEKGAMSTTKKFSAGIIGTESSCMCTNDIEPPKACCG